VIRCIDTKTRAVTTISGVPKKSGFNDGPAIESQFSCPCGLCLDVAGNLLVCDRDNNRIRCIDLKNKIVSTLAGNGENKTVDGPSNNASFDRPTHIVCDSAGNLFVSVWCDEIRRIDGRTGLLFRRVLGDVDFVTISCVLGYVSTIQTLHGCKILCCDEFNRLFGTKNWSAVLRVVSPYLIKLSFFLLEIVFFAA
jgi:sugar lactone lactonase YvrE